MRQNKYHVDIKWNINKKYMYCLFQFSLVQTSITVFHLIIVQDDENSISSLELAAEL